MSGYWPWFWGGLALATVALGHWLALHRTLAVSGRISALVDRVRFGAPEPAPEMTMAEMAEALRAATAEEFGEDAVADSAEPAAGPDAPAPAPAPAPASQSPAIQALFLGALIVGGALAAWTQGPGPLAPVATLRGNLFERTFGAELPLQIAALVAGGVLVGFGTRMAGGCTSGHGLCGTSRLQPGSLLATAAFFGMGVVTAFGLELLW